MNLKQYLWLMGLGTSVAWISFFVVLRYLTPETAGVLGILFMYLSIFLSITGTLTLLGFTWRYFRHRDEVLFRHVSISFRQAMLLACAVIVALFLSAQAMLTWWNVGLLLIGLTLFEFIMLSGSRLTSGDV